MNAAMELVARCGMHHPLLRLDSSVSSLPCRALWSAAREQLALARRCVCPEDKAVCLSNALACLREMCHNVDNTTSDATATSADDGLSGNGEPMVDGESSNAEAGASVVAADDDSEGSEASPSIPQPLLARLLAFLLLHARDSHPDIVVSLAFVSDYALDGAKCDDGSDATAGAGCGVGANGGTEDSNDTSACAGAHDDGPIASEGRAGCGGCAAESAALIGSRMDDLAVFGQAVRSHPHRCTIVCSAHACVCVFVRGVAVGRNCRGSCQLACEWYHCTSTVSVAQQG